MFESYLRHQEARDPAADPPWTSEISEVDRPAFESESPSPEQIAAALTWLRERQRLGRAVVAGIAASLVGAVLWAVITAVTRVQIGWMAIGVGALVGFAMGRLGRGIEPHFGYIGAGLAALGCLLGNFLAIYILIAIELDVPLMQTISELNPAEVARIMFGATDLFDVLFWGLAIAEGYRLSFREVTYADLLAGTEAAAAVDLADGRWRADQAAVGAPGRAV